MKYLGMLVIAGMVAFGQAPEGKPDLNGVWDIPYTPDMARAVPGGLPFTPLGEQAFKRYDASKDDATGKCMPAGLTRLVNTPFPMEIVQTPKKVALLFEGFSTFIVVPTDGRKHSDPKDLDPTWAGESIGWYEGDALIVDTIGFNDKTTLDTIGHQHSDQLHVIQRYTRTGPSTMGVEVTVEDPKMYAKPFTYKRTFKMAKGELMEYSCMENNKDFLEGHLK